jgi:prepilin-type N-terminal cleavage/methylation domain-containing protein
MRTIDRRGFTLIESMMACVVLAFCVVGLSTAIMAGTRNQDIANQSFDALESARAGMENVATRHQSDLSPATGGTTTESVTIDDLGDATSDVATSGSLTYISRDASQSARDIAIITVTARTRDGQTVTLKRLISRAENLK